jgi:molybdate transport system regulatory protein
MPRAKDVVVRVNVSTRTYLGPGKISLLEQVGKEGSISAAARSLNMSYRRAWLLIDALNTLFREPVVVSATGGKKGGGAALTAFGEELIKRYRRIETSAAKAAAKDIEALRKKIKPKA